MSLKSTRRPVAFWLAVAAATELALSACTSSATRAGQETTISVGGTQSVTSSPAVVSAPKPAPTTQPPASATPPSPATTTPTAASAPYPRGYPKIVTVSSLPDQVRNWYQIGHYKKAVAVAPGVWTPLPPGAAMQDALDSEVLDGFCASIKAYERKYLGGQEQGGTCW